MTGNLYTAKFFSSFALKGGSMIKKGFEKMVFWILLAPLLTAWIFASNTLPAKSELRDDYAIIQEYHIDVPFHYQEETYYCGPAALEMVFDYYGEDVPQLEIADVARTFPYTTYTDELIRAAHFSNQSISFGDEMVGNVSGYSARKVGYAAFEHWGLTINELKILIDEGKPLIVLMWGTQSKTYGHYRVIVGYNETHMVMHDPWNKQLWGGTYGGANTSMLFSVFQDLWSYSSDWCLLVCPWELSLNLPSTVGVENNLKVTANITYPCYAPFGANQYPAHFCNATIGLPEGLELASGEAFEHSMKDIIATDSVQTSWTIHVAEAGLYNVAVTASGIVNGNVGTHGNYSSYSYEDRIGGSSIASFSTVVFPTAKFEYSPSKPYADEEIIFNASASYSPEGNVTSYEWNFDDGNKTAITEPVINHTYNQPGMHNVTLTVTASSTLTNTATKIIPVILYNRLKQGQNCEHPGRFRSGNGFRKQSR